MSKGMTKSDALTVIDPFVVSEVPDVDKEMNERINRAVTRILEMDIRIEKEPEVISALRDYIMVEIAQMKVFEKIKNGEADNSDERVFRACLNAKSHLRDEIWGSVRGFKKKEQFTEAVHEVLVDQNVLPERFVPNKEQKQEPEPVVEPVGVEVEPDEGDKDQD